MVACKRGNMAARDSTGHCLCVDCKAFRAAQQKARGKTPAKTAWLAANKDRPKGYSAKWAAANPEKRRAIVNDWRARNPDIVAAMNAKGGKKWAANNPGKRLASVRARQLAKRLRTPAWADLAAIAEIYIEAAAKTRATGIPHEIDHELPLQGDLVASMFWGTCELWLATSTAQRGIDHSGLDCLRIFRPGARSIPQAGP